MIPNKIVVIGASTVYGWVDPIGGGFVGRLKSHLETQNNFTSVFNLGISGQTCKEITARIEKEIPPRNPKLILISLGANDSRREKSTSSENLTSLADFKIHVQQMLEQSSKIAKTLFIGSFPLDDSKTSPVPGTRLYYSNSDLEKYTSTAKEVSENLKVSYLDLFHLWQKKDYLKLLYKDGLHCNSDGHEELFKEVLKFVEENN